MPRNSAAGLHFRIIPAGFSAPLELLTGFTFHEKFEKNFVYFADFIQGGSLYSPLAICGGQMQTLFPSCH